MHTCAREHTHAYSGGVLAMSPHMHVRVNEKNELNKLRAVWPVRTLRKGLCSLLGQPQ